MANRAANKAEHRHIDIRALWKNLFLCHTLGHSPGKLEIAAPRNCDKAGHQHSNHRIFFPSDSFDMGLLEILPNVWWHSHSSNIVQTAETQIVYGLL